MLDASQIIRQIESLDLVINALVDNNHNAFYEYRDSLYPSFFKDSYSLKDEFINMFPVAKTKYIYNILSPVQKAGGYAFDTLIGAGGDIKINDAITGLKYIKDVLVDELNRINSIVIETNKKENGSVYGKEESKLPLLLRDVLDVSRNLQSNPYYIPKGTYENQRNTYVRDMLRQKKYEVDDQTLQGIANNGPAELDLLVKNNKSKRECVIEALNLSGLSTDYIIEHYNKMFKYDTKGNEYNIMLIYSNVDDLADLSEKYFNAINNSDKIKNKIVDVEEIGSESIRIKIMKTSHTINRITNYIYHIFIQFVE